MQGGWLGNLSSLINVVMLTPLHVCIKTRCLFLCFYHAVMSLVLTRNNRKDVMFLKELIKEEINHNPRHHILLSSSKSAVIALGVSVSSLFSDTTSA